MAELLLLALLATFALAAATPDNLRATRTSSNRHTNPLPEAAELPMRQRRSLATDTPLSRAPRSAIAELLLLILLATFAIGAALNVLAALAAGSRPTSPLRDVAGLLVQQRRRTLHLIVASHAPEASHG
jgi:hypothetical protein